eukprot:14832524-Heterocapsa_arctica.AAC.1
MLGVIHRTVLGRGPPHFYEVSKFAPHLGRSAISRTDIERHRFQLQDPGDKRHSVLLARSALGL